MLSDFHWRGNRLYHGEKQLGQIDFVEGHYAVMFAQLAGEFHPGVDDPSLPEFKIHYYRRWETAQMLAVNIAIGVMQRRGIDV